VKFHRVSGICETRTCDFRTRDLVKSDFPIWSREIIRSILWVSKTPDKGVEEHFSSSGQGKRSSCVSGRALGGAFAINFELVLEEEEDDGGGEGGVLRGSSPYLILSCLEYSPWKGLFRSK
jgi:hypothetical protein